MTSSGNPQPNELDSIVLDAALLDAPMPANDNASVADTALAKPAPVNTVPVNALADGSTAARADELVDRHYEVVYRQAYRLSGCVETAEDIAQETFVQAIGHLHQLRSREAERGWLLAIARRQFMRVLRKTVHKKHGRMVSIESPHVDADAVLCENAQAAAPIQEIENKDCVERALSELGTDARLVIVMHYFEELSYAQIAAELDIPIGTVMSRLSRSREQLRKVLDDPHPSTAQCNSVSSPLAQPHLACTNPMSQEARRG